MNPGRHPVGPGPVAGVLRLIHACRARLRRLPAWDGRTLREARPLDHGLLLRLAGAMAFTAGALDAGGFALAGFYTSHVTGNASHTAAELAGGRLYRAATFGSLIFLFVAGAFAAGMLLSYGKRQRHRARHAFTLGVEAVLLCVLGLAGQKLAPEHLFSPAPLALLSFVLGMHNAVGSTLANTDVRTTHMTGNATDLGVELSRLLYFNRGRPPKAAPVLANRRRLSLLLVILSFFTIGGVTGALAFPLWGWSCAFPLAGLLAFLSLPALSLDLETRLRLWVRQGT